jgi:hypothetical protein
MKHLLTAIACCLAVAGSAQTPYNPDSNGDNFIGSEDVLELLSEYGTDFFALPSGESLVNVEYNEEQCDGFCITEFADIYVIDARLAPEDVGLVIDHHIPSIADNGYSFPMNGAEYWFIFADGDDNTSYNIDMNAEGPYFYDEETNTGCYTGYSTSGIYVNLYESESGYLSGQIDCSEPVEALLPIMRKFLWLNGELIFLR